MVIFSRLVWNWSWMSRTDVLHGLGFVLNSFFNRYPLFFLFFSPIGLGFMCRTNIILWFLFFLADSTAAYIFVLKTDDPFSLFKLIEQILHSLPFFLLKLMLALELCFFSCDVSFYVADNQNISCLLFAAASVVLITMTSLCFTCCCW